MLYGDGGSIRGNLVLTEGKICTLGIKGVEKCEKKTGVFGDPIFVLAIERGQKQKQAERKRALVGNSGYPKQEEHQRRVPLKRSKSALCQLVGHPPKRKQGRAPTQRI